VDDDENIFTLAFFEVLFALLTQPLFLVFFACIPLAMGVAWYIDSRDD
jgi:hypothetical protein